MPWLKYQPANTTKEKYPSFSFKLFAITMALIFASEVLIMLLLNILPLLPFHIEILLDAVLLSFFVSLILYIFLLRPTKLHINERRQTEEILQRSEEKYRTLVETTNTGYLIVDLEGRVIDANSEYVRITGHHSLDEILGRSVIEWTAKHDLERNAEEVKKCGIQGFVRNLEMDYVDKKGKITTIEINATVIETQEGQKILSLCRDITERKRVEERLLESEKKYRHLFENLSDAVFLADVETGHILDTNKQGEVLLCRARHEIIGMHQSELHPPDKAEEYRQKFADHVKKEHTTEYNCEVIRKDGSIVLIDISAATITLGGKRLIFGLFRDVTERKQIEERLIKVNECFLSFGKDPLENINRLTALCGDLFGATAALYNRLDQGMLCSWGQWNTPPDYNPVDNPDGHICYDVIKKGDKEIFVVRNLLQSSYAQTDPNVIPYKLQTYVGKAVNFSGASVGSICVVFQRDFVPSEEDKRLIEIIASAIGVEEERRHAEWALRKSEQSLKTIFSSMKDGLAETDLDGKILRVNDYFCELLGYKPEELIGKSGLKYYPKEDWVRIKESFERFIKEEPLATSWELNLRTKNGDLIPVSSRRTLLKDKNGKPSSVMAIFRDMSEMKFLQAQLLQAEKLSATGVLISGVAHELNNPLTGIIGYSEILQKDDSLSIKAKERIKTIFEQANRCKNIILNLLKFARKYENKRTSVDINEVIDSTLNLSLYEMETTGIKVVKDLKKDIPETSADLNQLQQVILNLIQNAKHAMLPKTEGEKVLKIKTESLKDNIIIEVSDTGVGISDKNIQKIFDPFFTTKEVGKGTGLGLSISYGIIKEHGGNIEVRSKEGEGTTFTIELPIIQVS